MYSFYFPKYLCRIRKSLCAQCLHFDSSSGVVHFKASAHRSCNNTGWELFSASLCTNKCMNVTEGQTPQASNISSPFGLILSLVLGLRPHTTSPFQTHHRSFPKRSKRLINIRAGEYRGKLTLKASYAVL